MTYQDESGPAFPIHPSMRPSDDQASAEGMSLRDAFAKEAMGHLIRRCVSAEDWANLPFTAYEIANAMLEARKK